MFRGFAGSDFRVLGKIDETTSDLVYLHACNAYRKDLMVALVTGSEGNCCKDHHYIKWPEMVG
jgi:hypothetical protein